MIGCCQTGNLSQPASRRDRVAAGQSVGGCVAGLPEQVLLVPPKV
jgi:hypothetical protein